MDDTARITEWLRRGTLLPPVGEAPSSVDLARALGQWAGAAVPALNRAGRQILGLFGDAQQIVFVLVDGLGCNLRPSLPADAFLRHAPARELRAVFPSTTAAAVTSFATGAWPSQHAAPGWFTYLPDADRTATILPFVDRFSGAALATAGITPADVFPLPPLARSMQAGFRPVHPASIARSVYTRYHWGGQGARYHELPEGVDLVLAAAAGAADTGANIAPARRTLHFLYIPSVDAAEHHHGHQSPEATAALAAVDDQLARLAAALPPETRLVLSSDHGMLTVPDHARHVLSTDDPLLDLLRVPPSGEPRVPFFHPRPGMDAAFAAEFRHRFGERFALLSVADSDALRLWGPDPLSPLARERVGSFIALSDGPDVLLYDASPAGHPGHLGSDAPKNHAFANVLGFHAGLTPDEMRIPLIVI